MSARESDRRRASLRLAIPESEWPARIRAGDERAFEAMFRAYYDTLYRYVIAFLGEHDAAEDVIQLIFARIWQDRENWEVRGPLRHYLLVAARCGAISYVRHDAVRERAAPLLAIEIATRGGLPIADAEYEAEELRRRFTRALETLPPRAREAFVLSRREGLSYDEVALRMGISIRTVETHVGKVLAILRKVLPLAMVSSLL